MKVLLFIPVVLSILVLAAHFLRGDNLLLVVLVLGLLVLLAVRRPWVARLMQVVLVVGAIEWVRTLVALAMSRAEQGEPYLRMTLILGAVAVITLLSAWLFQTATLRKVYGLDGAAR